MKSYILDKVNKLKNVEYVKRLILVFITDCLTIVIATFLGYFSKCLMF